MDFARQIKLVGTAQIFYAGMRLVGNLVFRLILSSIASSDPPVSSPLFILSLVAALPALAAGIGLLMKQPWARLAAVAAGATELVMFPMGTILGLLTLWLMSKKEVAALVADWGGKELTVDDMLATMPESDKVGDADHHMK
jgi:nicotinamide riboside transporter PnuC